MSSQNASAEVAARRPLRKRGRERVAQLLAAAAVVFAEQGYDKATMTDIAARAGASIGSLYQFFPTKDLLADALHEEEVQALTAFIQTLQSTGERLTPAACADRLVHAMPGFLAQFPAFLALADRRALDKSAKQATRQNFRRLLAEVLRRTKPPLEPRQAEIAAVLVLHFLKVAMSLAAEEGLDVRDEALAALRRMLRQQIEAMV